MCSCCLALLITVLCLPAAGEMVDYASGDHRDAWLRHPVFGDPSFDNFVRLDDNPVHRGEDPYAWPVNGFLFEDPQTGFWYLYVGEYPRGYDQKVEAPFRALIYRSEDKGAAWTFVGPVFSDKEHFFEGEQSPTWFAPDVSVTYHDGRYHLAYDWSTKNSTWANAFDPGPDANNGAGYAWADSPEGPFHRTARPIVTTRDTETLHGKYRRMYASTIIKRANDWLVLTLTDSHAYFGWGYVGMTAEKPEGPYTEPKLLLHPQRAAYHPPLLEFHPAFVHDGYVYAPATSVALNRNYQGLFRAPLEDATDPDAWQLVQAGNIWHAEPFAHEHFGIWGQTFSGFVDGEGMFNVMFPSRDVMGNGTINIARRPWDQPFRERGFMFSGHAGPSITVLKRTGTPDEIAVTLKPRRNITVFWDGAMAFGADRPRSDASLHGLTKTDYTGLHFSDGQWRLVRAQAGNELTVISEGQYDASTDQTDAVVQWQREEAASLSIDGKDVWSGTLARSGGLVGLLADSFSQTEVNRFAVSGLDERGEMELLYTDALLGAAQNLADWEEVTGGHLRHGVGAVSRSETAMAKWNFEGSGFKLWAPRGPDFGTARVLLDGVEIGEINFNSAESEPSAVVFEYEGLDAGSYGVVLQSIDGRIPVDTLTAQF